MIKQQQFDDQVIWYEDSYISQPSPQLFDIKHWHQQGKVFGSAQGRGTTWFVHLDKIDAALRHYRRGGLVGRFVKDSYLFSGFTESRSYLEMQTLHHLRQTGVNVPHPIAARCVKSGPIYQADLLSEKIPNATSLLSLLKENPLSDDIYQKIGMEIHKMHSACVNHTDLNIGNILIDDQQQVWIIDFDKSERRSSPHGDWKAKNWARLQRSFEKEKVRNHIYWDQNDWRMMR